MCSVLRHAIYCIYRLSLTGDYYVILNMLIKYKKMCIISIGFGKHETIFFCIIVKQTNSTVLFLNIMLRNMRFFRPCNTFRMYDS